MDETRASEWAAVFHFADGGRAYYAQDDRAPVSAWRMSPYRGNAIRFESEEAALYMAHSVKDTMPRVVGVSAEEINPRPGLKSGPH